MGAQLLDRSAPAAWLMPRAGTAVELSTGTPLPVMPNLTYYDLIVVWSSGGKDSQEALREAVIQARLAGVLDRIVVAHNDLGDEEWPGTLDLAHRQAAHYGLPFRVVRRSDGLSLLDDIAERGKFPDSSRRWCTSDHKRGPGLTLLTALVRKLGLTRPARVLQVYGFRAAESKARADRQVIAVNTRATRAGKVRQVTDWLPVHDRSDAEIWDGIRSSGVPYHWAYARGMSRLSCSFCVLSGRDDLLTAARLRPRKLGEYMAVETRTGHAFQYAGKGRPKPIADIATLAGVDFDNPPCEMCSAGLDEGLSPEPLHAVPDLVAAAMFGRSGLVCDGVVMRDADTGRAASPFWDQGS